MDGVQFQIPLIILCHGDQMESWSLLVQFEKSLEQFTGRIWTVSLANRTHHKESKVYRNSRFREHL